MNFLSVLLLLLLALWGVWAVRRILAGGGCSSCGGDCASCRAACRQKQIKTKGSDPE